MSLQQIALTHCALVRNYAQVANLCFKGQTPLRAATLEKGKTVQRVKSLKRQSLFREETLEKERSRLGVILLNRVKFG